MDIALKKAEEPNASTIRPGEPECEAAYQTISGPVGNAIASMLGGLSKPVHDGERFIRFLSSLESVATSPLCHRLSKRNVVERRY